MIHVWCWKKTQNKLPCSNKRAQKTLVGYTHVMQMSFILFQLKKASMSYLLHFFWSTYVHFAQLYFFRHYFCFVFVFWFLFLVKNKSSRRMQKTKILSKEKKTLHKDKNLLKPAAQHTNVDRTHANVVVAHIGFPF